MQANCQHDIFEPLHALNLLQAADAQVVGVASLPLPHAQQVATIALDSQGFLHLFSTPLSPEVVVWDADKDVPSAPLTEAGQQFMSEAALHARSGAATSQGRDNTTADNPGSGEGIHLQHCQATNFAPVSPPPPILLVNPVPAPAQSDNTDTSGYILQN